MYAQPSCRSINFNSSPSIIGFSRGAGEKSDTGGTVSPGADRMKALWLSFYQSIRIIRQLG
jgi:hypothetical protein